MNVKAVGTALGRDLNDSLKSQGISRLAQGIIMPPRLACLEMHLDAETKVRTIFLVSIFPSVAETPLDTSTTLQNPAGRHPVNEFDSHFSLDAHLDTKYQYQMRSGTLWWDRPRSPSPR